MSDEVKELLLIAAAAAATGVQRLISGASRDEALEATISQLADERAKRKFPELVTK